MTPWKWNDEKGLWVNSTTGKTMTAIEYDDARCNQIALLETQKAALLEALRAIQAAIETHQDKANLGWIKQKVDEAIQQAKEKRG